jgi:hypothetical protein
MRSVRTLLQGSIDYAGLFPPAALDMRTAVRNYADYRAGSHAWALGRFILPVSRLAEFDTAADSLLPRRPQGAPWPVSALVGPDLTADLERLGEFNCRHAADGAGAASADVIELKASSVKAVETALRSVPTYAHAYVEIPLDDDPAELVAAIARLGGRAKVRTGGVTPDAFPSAAHLVRFIRRCEEAAIPFKATAGLHHPLRAEYRLTYAADSASAPMHGFMNLFLAAAFVFAGMSDDEAIALLDEPSPTAFRISDEGIEWRGHRLGLDALTNARERAVVAFGSCSFTEPIDELTALDWL